MNQPSGKGASAAPADRLSADEERVLLVLARAAKSLTMTEVSDQLETPPDALRDALRSLYRRRFLVISRGIGQIEDTYLLSQHARDYTRHNLLPDAPRHVAIEALTPANRRR